MSNQNDKRPSEPPLTLAPPDTVVGAMERAFLTETRSPVDPKYDPSIDIEAMRNMRQVIINRLKAPQNYVAKGAKNEIDIFKAPGQFPEFVDYPKNIPEYVSKNLTKANKTNDPNHEAYREHVQHAIMAATEDVTKIRASLPEATGWVKTPREGKAKPPWPNAYPLGDVGGNSFFGTKPASSAVEWARHHAAQARAQARAKPVPAHMKLPHLLIQMHRAGHGVSPVFRSPPAGHAASRDDRAGAAARSAPPPTSQARAQAAPSLSSLPRVADMSGRTFAPVAPVGGDDPFGRRAAIRRGDHALVNRAPVAPAPEPRRSASPTRGPQAPAAIKPDQLVSPQPILSASNIDQAWDDYFWHLSRQPPHGISGFDINLTPLWRGQKLPG